MILLLVDYKQADIRMCYSEEPQQKMLTLERSHRLQTIQLLSKFSNLFFKLYA